MRLFKAKQAASFLLMVEDRCILGEEDKDIARNYEKDKPNQQAPIQ